MDCLEDADISIRLLALELSVKMIDGDTLQTVVNRLISQLHGSSLQSPEDSSMDVECLKALGPGTPSRSADPERQDDQEGCEKERALSLPVEYRIEVLHRILDVCSYNNYSELSDFEWYVEVLVQLVRLLPPASRTFSPRATASQGSTHGLRGDIASRIGSEVRNVAVRVRNVRMKATRVAESLVLVENRNAWLPIVSNANSGILGPLAWVVGEYAEYLLYPSRALDSLIDMPNVALPARTLSFYIQAIPKIFTHLVHDGESWSQTRRSEASLMLGRVIGFLEVLAAHPDLDVQERAIEFLEVLRLAAETVHSEAYQPDERPFLLSSVIPSLFSGLELNPVALSAQGKVPLPERLALEKDLQGNLPALFFESSDWPQDSGYRDPIKVFYSSRDVRVAEKQQKQQPEASQIDLESRESYQNPVGLIGDLTDTAQRTAERAERNRDDPFYIGSEEETGSRKSTPLNQGASMRNDEEINIDAIPVIDLRLDDQGASPMNPLGPQQQHGTRPRKYEVVPDETIGYDEPTDVSMGLKGAGRLGKVKSPLLQVDSSGLGRLPLERERRFNPDAPRNLTAMDRDEEMVRAMREVEKARLEMQRASERVHSSGMPTEGMPVSRKKKGRKSARKDAAVKDSHGGRSVAQETSNEP